MLNTVVSMGSAVPAENTAAENADPQEQAGQFLARTLAASEGTVQSALETLGALAEELENAVGGRSLAAAVAVGGTAALLYSAVEEGLSFSSGIKLNRDMDTVKSVFETFQTAGAEGKALLRQLARDDHPAGAFYAPDVSRIIDSSLDEGYKDKLTAVFCKLMAFLPSDMSDEDKAAVLCGGHIVFEDKTIDSLHLTKNEKKGLINRTETSSHYKDAENPAQYGMNLNLNGCSCHLLFGKTTSGKLFMQLERHAAYSGIMQSIVHLPSVSAHLLDFVNHKISGAQVGPFGLVDASEKNGSHYVVKGKIMQKAAVSAW